MKRNIIINSLFLIIELILYVLFSFFSSGESTSYLQYMSILVIFTWLILSADKNLDAYLVIAAIFFTLISDYFLLLADNKIIAMFSFIIVQLLYGLRILKLSKTSSLPHVATRITLSLFLVLIAVIVVKDGFDLLVLLTMVYFANLLANAIFSFIPKKINIYLSLGLILFICCDIIVGFYNLSDYIFVREGSIIDYIVKHPINLAWIFYLPSQVLIGFSVKQNKTKKIFINN